MKAKISVKKLAKLYALKDEVKKLKKESEQYRKWWAESEERNKQNEKSSV